MTDGLSGIVNQKWLENPEGLRSEFEGATPFPYIVLDSFLDDDFAHELLKEFPAVGEMPKSRDYMFGNKHELSSVEEQGGASARFYQAVLSTDFRDFLRAATGYDGLFVDPDFHGGGFHQGSDGSFLDMHVDFNMHPLHPDWLRTVNVLIYLNEDWQSDWGGDLLITNSPDVPPTAVAPSFNRALLMLTSDNTYHGYNKMSLPDGVTRKSIATYSYQVVDEKAYKARTTGWAPQDAGLVKRVIAGNYNAMVKAKNKVLGSRTAKNR